MFASHQGLFGDRQVELQEENVKCRPRVEAVRTRDKCFERVKIFKDSPPLPLAIATTIYRLSTPMRLKE